MCVKSLSHVRLLVTPWTVACQAPPSVEFSRQEYWSGLPCHPPGDLPDPGIKPVSLMNWGWDEGKGRVLRAPPPGAEALGPSLG